MNIDLRIPQLSLFSEPELDFLYFYWFLLPLGIAGKPGLQYVTLHSSRHTAIGLSSADAMLSEQHEGTFYL